MAGNDIGVECPRFIARATRFKGVMVNDFAILGGASGFIGIIFSEMFTEAFGWLTGLGLAIFSWCLLKGLTDGKHDGTFNIWLHRKKISKLKGFPKPVSEPIKYGVDIPNVKRQAGLMDTFVVGEQGYTDIWSRGLNRAEDSDWMKMIDKEKKYSSDVDSFYTELGRLQTRINRLVIIRWSLIAYIAYLFYYQGLLEEIRRPPFYFEGVNSAGVVEIEYVKDFDKASWVKRPELEDQ
jgi:hypothetical protein